MRRSNIVATSVTMFALILIGCWLVDICFSASATNAFLFVNNINAKVELTNGFFVFNYAQMYHVGLYLIILASFILMLLVIALAVD